MVDRIAIKILSGSDLTFFDTMYKKLNVGNQKAINLNADVFAKMFYPSLDELAVSSSVEVPVTVTVFGPGFAGPYRFARSITKGAGYKNWRLNGSAVPDPEAEPGRFGDLTAGDVAVLEFLGEPEPKGVKVVVVSQTSDQELVDHLTKDVPGGKKSMAPVTRARLSDMVEAAASPPEHPVRVFLHDRELQVVLEELALGSEAAARRLKGRTGRKVTQDDLLAAKASMERIGSYGEALAWFYLKSLEEKGEIMASNWISMEDAAASWDFLVRTKDGVSVRFDAKSTSGGFERPVFLSGPEIVAASSDETSYRIIRVHELSEDGGFVRVSEDINELSRQIRDLTEHLPAGVVPTSFSIDPDQMNWAESVWVERPDDPD